MEDYIFLIIAVVISIFAAINKNNKNKIANAPLEQEEEEVETKRRNYFMDQLLGEDFLEEKEEMEAPPMRVQPAPSNVAYKSSQDNRQGLNYKLPEFKSTLPDRPKHKTITSTQRYKEELETMDEVDETGGFMEDFSLRKAVVYSIIMERKDY